MPPQPQNLELNEQFIRAYELMEHSRQNLFISKAYLGVEAEGFERKDIRAFRVDRILEIKHSSF